MKPQNLVPMGAALFALSLGVASVLPTLASAREETGATTERIIRVAQQEDRDSDRDSGSGYLGVQVQRLSAALRRAKGIPESTEGTLVSNVEDGSPADNAGVKRGDLILEVNHKPTADPGDLVETVRGLDPGRRVSVLIWRDGVTKSFSLTVGSRPAESEMPMPPPRMPNWNQNPGDDSRDTPTPPPTAAQPRMEIYRRNRADLERQVHDLQDQLDKLRNEELPRLEHEIQDLRASLQQQNNQNDRRGRDRDDRRDRDRDRDNNSDDD
jgi:hypothetical protein